MGSSRLPGKVLAPLGGRSILAQCIERLRAARVGEVVVATTTRPEDEAVVAEAAAPPASRVVRGPVDDVLGRFVARAGGWTGPYVIRATADNPVVDIDGPARLLRVLDGGADYASRKACRSARPSRRCASRCCARPARWRIDAYDREHVTPFSGISRSIASTVCAAPAPFELLPAVAAADRRHPRRISSSCAASSSRPATRALVPLREVIALADRSAGWAGVA